MTSKALPSQITSYDLLKTFAVIIMVVDHIGAFFYPDVLWWRAIGRVGFPVWFFLVGHASGRDLPFKLVGSASILVGLNFIVGMAIFPLNALFTIIAIRLLIDPVMSFAKRSDRHLWLLTAVFIPLVIVTYPLTEYGTIGLMTAMFGYMVRHKDVFAKDTIFAFMVTVLITFLLVQYGSFDFTIMQFAAMGVGTAIIRLMLLDFRPMTFPQLTERLMLPVRWFLQFCGRKTLEIYVVHLIIFKLVAMYLGIGDLALFGWSWGLSI